MNVIAVPGRRVVGSIVFGWEVFLLFYHSLRAAVLSREQSYRAQLQVVAQQIYYTGYQALPAIVVLGCGVGFLMVMQSNSNLNLIGSQNMLGQLFVTLIVREVAPLLTALIVIARSGTAVATELGNMKVNREVEALEAIGINPLAYVVAPRLLGGVVSVFCLCLYFLFAAFFAGLVLAMTAYDLPADMYANSILLSLSRDDVILFLIKIIVSGAIIFSVCSYRGLRVQKASYEVPQATTGAVVESVMLVMAVHLCVTAASYAHKLKALGVL